jgi:NADH-quinone oxidoreductase subunit M
MTDWPILSLVAFLPLAGAAFILLLNGTEEAVARNARWAALWTSIVVFVLSLPIWFGFDRASAEFQFVERHVWIPGYGIGYHVGVDGISAPFVLLSTFLTPICIAASWHVEKRVREYMIAFLVLETFMVGTFIALDMVLFYVFFEAVLIPMFLIIGVWGGARRVYSAFKFFLYTLLGSVLMLIAMLAMYWQTETTNIVELFDYDFPRQMQMWLWLAFFASFAVKVPMWPVHTWLPDAHVEAPTAGSVILAGVLLKMGGYGMIRFSLPMFPEASDYFTPLVFALSIVAVIYTSLVALVQEDMKKLIAYSSVAHMGFVTLGLFAGNRQGVEGAMFQMIAHGVVSGALFLCVGVVYDRLHTREIKRYGGLVHRMPVYAAVFMVFTMGAVGLPGTAGFVGEILVLTGTFQASTWAAALASTGVILGAAYMLYLYRRVIFGKLVRDDLKDMPDLEWREKLIFAPLIVATLWLGIQPKPVLDMMGPTIQAVVDRYESERGTHNHADTQAPTQAQVPAETAPAENAR